MMAAINSPNCSAVSGLVLLLAINIERGGIGFLGTPVTGERHGSAAHRYRELMAAILRLKVRGFIRSASTSRRSSSTQSWQNAGLISRRCRWRIAMKEFRRYSQSIWEGTKLHQTEPRTVPPVESEETCRQRLEAQLLR